MENSKIIERKYFAIPIRLASPLCLSNGEDEYTDSDILKNASGDLFIPGSSIAGAFRDYLSQGKDEKGIFGFSKDEEGRMSSITISDLYLNKNLKVSVRDGVKLNSDKNVLNKFDMEIIETGAEGILYFDYVKRVNDEWDYDTEITTILKGIKTHEIRFGGNKTRGMGCIDFDQIYVSTFHQDKLNEYLLFAPKQKSAVENLVSVYEKTFSLEEWNNENKSNQEMKYFTITVPLKLTGGISIRKYSTKPKTADYEHITANGKPVIPGSSWNGAIRADMRNILNDLGCKNTDHLLRMWFGCVDEDLKSVSEAQKNHEEAHQSFVVIGESVIEGASMVPMTRNQISRYDASTIDGALYSEIACFGGTTELKIMIRKDTNGSYLALLEALQLVISDITEGYLPIGGLVSVGRGIFTADDKPITYSENIPTDIAAALYDLL